MYKVEIEFPTKEHAQAFMRWLDNSGEQDYLYIFENEHIVDTFHYDYHKLNIRGECIQESEDE